MGVNGSSGKNHASRRRSPAERKTRRGGSIVAKLRSVNTHFWTDRFIVELDPIGKLLFIYLITNPTATLVGCYEITVRQIVFDTGIEKEKILDLFEYFEKERKLIYRDGWVVLPNFLKNQSLNSNMKKHIAAELQKVPDWVRETVVKAIKSSPDLRDDAESFGILTQPLPNTSKRRREEEVEGESEAEKEIATDVAAVFAEWQIVLNHPKAKLDKTRSTKIKARLKDYTVDELRNAIKGVSKSPYHLGENDAGTRYDGISTIFKNADQVDKFIALANNPKRQTPGSTYGNGHDQNGDLLSPDYEMPVSRNDFESAADIFFTMEPKASLERYEGMKRNWLRTPDAEGHKSEIEEYERTARFEQRFSKTGPAAA